MLQVRTRGNSQRQSALRATIDWSYALLEAEDRRMMARLAVFAGGWTLEAAEQVCGEWDAMGRLHSLIEKSIVVFDDRTGRYRFLETVRQYAAEKLLASGEADKIHACHRAWCMDFAERAKPGIRGPDQVEWLRLADLEWPNLRMALDHGEQDPDYALKLAGAIWYYLYLRSARGDYHYLREALVREGADDPSGRAEVLLGLGAINFHEEDYDASKAALSESLSIFQSIDDKGGVGRALSTLGNVATVADDYKQAVEYYEKSLVLLREAGDRSTTALTLSNLAMQAAQHNDFPKAEQCHEEGLKVAQEIGSDRLIAWHLMGLANMALRRGDGSSRFTLEQEALQMFQKLGDKRGMADCIMQQGIGDQNQGDAASAIPKLEESVRIFREIGDHRNAAYSNVFLARANMDSGDLAKAEALVKPAQGELDDLKRPGDSAEARYVLSLILHLKGDASRSWDLLVEAIGIWVEIDDRPGIASSLERIAERAVHLCEDEQGAYFFGAAETLRTTIGVPRLEVDEPSYQRHRNEARNRLGDQRFEKALEAGQAATWQEAVARARELTL
jgi:tetratricopeptide (TPR) repeat protein